MAALKDLEIKSLTDGEQKKEPLGSGRGSGSLVVRRVKDVIPAYYCYWKGKQAVFIKLDNYKCSARSPGKSLAELRTDALEMATLRKRIAPIDLKNYLQNKKDEATREEEREHVRKQEEALLGTFSDLLRMYVKDLKKRKRITSDGIAATIENHIIAPHPLLACKKACEIQRSDISTILRPVHRRGVKFMYNRVKGCLSAAFNFGLQFDDDPRKEESENKRFSLEFNPAARFADEKTQPRKRELSHHELRTFWEDIEKGALGLNSQYGLFAQFCIACFGNRPKQLSRVKWSDIDLVKRTLTFTDFKGEGQPRITTIPLTDRAIHILSQLTEQPQR